MEIEKEKTFGRPSIKFTDSMGDACYIWIMDNLGELRFDLDTDFAQFSREDIKTLLPYLQSFAQTGQLEPPTLQREESIQEKDLEGNLERASELAFVLAKRIEALEELISLKDKIALEEQLEIVQEKDKYIGDLEEAGVAMAANIVEQGKRIQALEQLVKEWKKFGQSSWESQHPAALVHQTNQLLGE